MGQWKQAISSDDLVTGIRLKNVQGKEYEVISASDQTVTLKKLGTERLTLEYKVSLMVQKVQIWEG